MPSILPPEDDELDALLRLFDGVIAGDTNAEAELTRRVAEIEKGSEAA